MQMIGKYDHENEISLYFHLPFCKKKCHYCHFYVVPDDEELKDCLLTALKNEWRNYLSQVQDKKIVSIYFGGGTPSLFAPARIDQLLSMIRNDTGQSLNDVEISLEVNPEDVTNELIQAFVYSGINRMSMGVQTLENKLLKFIGRNHLAERSLQAIDTILENGISNLSVDLMYDLPDQMLEGWTSTLKVIAKKKITHLSLYNMTIEPRTLFFKMKSELAKRVPNEEESLEMYLTALKSLTEAEFTQYEISAFCRNGAISIHNAGYWTARPFIGLGPSAFSYWDERRFSNIAHLRRYATALENNESPIDFDEKLDPEAKKRELLVVRLRLLDGISIEFFEKYHGRLSEETLQTIQDLQEQALLEREDQKIKLTKKGILLYNYVASELV